MKLTLGLTPRDYSVAGGTVVYDTDAQAYFTANTAITSDADKNAINTFYLGLKSDGIYTKIKTMYLPIWGTAAASKWNLVNPQDTNAAFRLTFSTGWTFSTGGALPNGTSAYADTFFTPSTTLTLNSSHISYYSRTNYDGGGIDFGSVSNPGNNGSIYANLKSSNTVLFRVNTSNTTQTESSISVTDSRKFYVINRNISTTETTFVNGVANNVTKSSNVQPTIKVYLGCLNLGNVATVFGRRQCAFASIGNGLTDTEASNLYTRVQTLMTYFGINV